MTEKPTIFLSYAHEDSSKATGDKIQPVVRWLDKIGCPPWVDSKSDCLKPGDRWEEEIYRAVLGVQFFLACLSMNSVRKIGFVQREWEVALEVNRASAEHRPLIIPLRLEKCAVPRHLADFQYLDWYGDHLRESQAKLKAILLPDQAGPQGWASLLNRLGIRVPRSR